MTSARARPRSRTRVHLWKADTLSAFWPQMAIVGRCLHLASAQGSVHIVKVLVKHGANLNARDSMGRTPLADCIKGGHSDVSHWLIEQGAELGYDELEASGELCELARSGDLERIRMLLAGKCDPNSADCPPPATRTLMFSGTKLKPPDSFSWQMTSARVCILRRAKAIFRQRYAARSFANCSVCGWLRWPPHACLCALGGACSSLVTHQ